MLIFVFRIYIYALAVLQCQGEPEEPRVLLRSTGSLGPKVIADLNLGLLERGFLTQNVFKNVFRNTCLSDPKHSIGTCCIGGNVEQVKFPKSICQRGVLQGGK